MSDTDIVYFLMPDGTKVSNDPRWLATRAADAAAELLASTPYRGNEGIPDEEMLAQVGGGVAPGQSGQPGVGESPAATVDQMLAGKVTGAVMNPDAAALATAAGFDPMNPGVPTPETPDSNEAVMAAREKAAKAAAALEEAGEDAGDPEVDKEEWTAKQLKAEALARNAARPPDAQIDLSGVKKKSDLVALLKADDASHA
jgi:hypothetical protein